jgi:hypothetical protein
MAVNYTGHGPGGAIQAGVDQWTPVQGEQVRQDLVDHDDRLTDVETTLAGGAGSGDVTGPASSTDNEVALFDGTTGKTIKGSGGATISGANTGDVTLAGTPNYIQIIGQAITRFFIDLASHVTGRLPFANLTAATSANRLLGRGSSGGAGDFQEIALGAGLLMSGTTLSATGGGGGGALDDLSDVVISSPATNDVLQYDGAEWVNSPSAIANDAVTNAKLANMATQTIKGRTTAGTGDPEDLTAAQATAILNTMVGDSGSGGTKGLVAAPSAGDAAAGKFWKASGAWAVPPGGGDVSGPASSVDAEIALFDSTTGKLIKRATGTGFVRAASGVYTAAKLKRVVGAIIGDGTNVISTGVSGFVSCPVAGVITKVRLLSSDAAVTSGSIVVDIWRDTYGNYPPTVADTITASAKPTISSATKAEDSTLTGWTTAVSAGDVFGFNVDSVTNLKRVTLELTVEES